MADDKPADDLPRPAIATVSPSYTAILQEHDVIKGQRDVRIKLIKDIEKLESEACKKKKAAVIAHIAKEGGPGSLESADIPVLGNMLRSVGDVHCLSLVLQSPGGGGTLVEKIVSM